MAVPPADLDRAPRRNPARPIALNSDLGGNWANRVIRRRDCARLVSPDRLGKMPADSADADRQFLPVCGRLYMLVLNWV
jgi:hypothetical protein